MFTGIIRDVGRITDLNKQGDWLVTIATQLPLDKTVLGASIACNGICLTVTHLAAAQFTVQISLETLSKTTAVHWHKDTRLNLEPALRAGDELGGHMVSGHVDGLARVISRKSEGDSLRYVLEVPKSFGKYLAPKGSITLDGVSLTINQVQDVRFDVNIIPHTQHMTTWDERAVGDEVNFEVDMIARYIERMIIQKNLP